MFESIDVLINAAGIFNDEDIDLTFKVNVVITIEIDFQSRKHIQITWNPILVWIDVCHTVRRWFNAQNETHQSNDWQRNHYKYRFSCRFGSMASDADLYGFEACYRGVFKSVQCKFYAESNFKFNASILSITPIRSMNITTTKLVWESSFYAPDRREQHSWRNLLVKWFAPMNRKQWDSSRKYQCKGSCGSMNERFTNDSTGSFRFSVPKLLESTWWNWLKARIMDRYGSVIVEHWSKPTCPLIICRCETTTCLLPHIEKRIILRVESGERNDNKYNYCTALSSVTALLYCRWQLSLIRRDKCRIVDWQFNWRDANNNVTLHTTHNKRQIEIDWIHNFSLFSIRNVLLYFHQPPTCSNCGFTSFFFSFAHFNNENDIKMENSDLRKHIICESALWLTVTVTFVPRNSF